LKTARRCIVTGANGFIGSNVVRSLMREGYEVTALVGPGVGLENLEGLNVEIREFDLLDREGLRDALTGGTHLIHTAANYSFWYPDPYLAYRVNVEGTRNVMEAARDFGFERIVHTSSTATLSPFAREPGEGTETLGDEERILNLSRFGGYYKHSKIMADMLVARFAACGLPVVTVLPTIVLGEGDRRPTPTGSMIVHFINRRMKAYVEMPQNLVHVGDAADGHVRALERGRNGHRYILGGDDLDMRSVVRILAEITGIPAPRIVLPQKLFRVLAVAEDWLARSVFPHEPLFPLEAALHARDSERFCTDKARKELGFQPRPAEVVLRRAVAWFVADGHCKNRLTRKAIQARLNL